MSPIPFAYHGQINWPASLPAPSAIKHPVSGDFTGDGLQDVILIVSSKAFLLEAPDTHEQIFSIASSTLTDIERIDPAANTMPCELATVGASGLERAIWSSTTRTFSLTHVSGDSVWVNAKFVRVGLLDNDNVPDYVGINTAGNMLVVRYGATQVQNTYALPELVNDIAIVQWDDTADREIALLDTYGVEVVTRTGARVRRFAHLATGSDAFTPYRKLIDLDGDGIAEEPEGRDRLAWIRRQTSGGGQELVELSQRDGLVTVVSPNTPYTFASGDLAVNLTSNDSPSVDTSVSPPVSHAADGNDELLINRMSMHAPLLLKNHATAGPVYSFSPGAAWEETVDDPTLGLPASGVPGYATMPKPIYRDLSGDGVPDLFLAVFDGTSLYFQFWRGAKDIAGWNGTGLTAPSNGSYIHQATYVPLGAGASNDSLAVQFAPGIVPAQGQATALDTLIWSRSSTGQYTAVSRQWFAISPGAPVPNTVAFALPMPAGFNVCSSDQLWFEFRFANTVYTNGVLTDLVALDTNYVSTLARGTSVSGPIWDSGFSKDRCVGNTSPCYLTINPPVFDGIACGGGGGSIQPTFSPGAVTRRRTPVATPGPMPPPPAPPQNSSGTLN